MGIFDFFKKNSNSKQNADLTSMGVNDQKFKNSWNYNFMELLKKARNGDEDEINELLKIYSPLAAVNENLSAFILFRHFQVQYWNDERSVLNCHPKDKNFQYGITIVEIFEDGGASQHNVYLPNNLNYKKLKIQGNEIEIITNEDKVVKTNVKELHSKLWMNFTEEEIENGYKSLCNEQYQKPKKPEVKNTTIKISSLGELIYNEMFEWYEGNFEIENHNFELSIGNTEPKKLKHLISFVDEQMKSKFYKKILLEMEDKMIELKNEFWLGEEEPPITSEDFQKRISINSIAFNEDCTCSIYCDDDDIFWGHSIEIDVDEKGKYKDANLAG